MTHTVATFDGGYSRKGKIWIEWGPCFVCPNKETFVLAIDGSEVEYEAGRICEDCIRKAFEDLRALNK